MGVILIHIFLLLFIPLIVYPPQGDYTISCTLRRETTRFRCAIGTYIPLIGVYRHIYSIIQCSYGQREDPPLGIWVGGAPPSRYLDVYTPDRCLQAYLFYVSGYHLLKINITCIRLPFEIYLLLYQATIYYQQKNGRLIHYNKYLFIFIIFEIYYFRR